MTRLADKAVTWGSLCRVAVLIVSLLSVTLGAGWAIYEAQPSAFDLVIKQLDRIEAKIIKIEEKLSDQE